MSDPSPAPERPGPPSPIRWSQDRTALIVLDQTALPEAETERTLATLEEVAEAIESLRVRGAPLIGITAAMAVAALARRAASDTDRADPGPSSAPAEPTAQELATRVLAWCDRLEATRPTAVNLRWALERMRGVVRRVGGAAGSAAPGEGDAPRDDLVDALTREADRIRAEDEAMCRAIGEHALALLDGAGGARRGSDRRPDGLRLLTHCNAGALATGGIGTALAPMYLAVAAGRPPRVWVGETRPLLQGSRLTAWELDRAGVDVTLMADDMAAALFATEPPDAVLVGADRIAANGDTANKIGTYGLAVFARHHGVPFYVLAPTSTVDLDTPTGADIPIEQRGPDEIRRGFGRATAPENVRIWSPAFDVTPAELVTAIVTEQGVHRAPYGPALRAAVEDAPGTAPADSVRGAP